ncbi:MAG: hypothetical protein LQ338_000197 [Usnochroma carphineum]|nr:MAG: hypothetical protein LQ338_000197 [Usnochroma carphineum]
MRYLDSHWDLFNRMSRYNNKILDLSNPIRLSGLSSGAKLELALLSRSPSVVSVALQLPENEAQGIPGGRLIGKYPSNTTLWLVLRDFEHKAPHRNYTQRGKSRTANSESGAGRLYHEAPVLSIMGRELSSFTDLQKTLAQLGYNHGSVLLRLSFRISETPLEEAMEQIDLYFKSVEGGSRAGAHATSMTTSESIPDNVEPILAEEDSGAKSPAEPMTPKQDDTVIPGMPSAQQQTRSPTSEETPPSATTTSATTTTTAADSGQRPRTVYKPSSSSAPRAAQQRFQEADFEPTIRQAKLHQARLQQEGRNKTLLSDKELAEKENARAQKLAEIKAVEIRIRFPDGLMTHDTFSNLDTAKTLYDFVKEDLNNESEPFVLKFTSNKGTRTIPQNSTERLIADLGMSGRTLVNFLWDEGASLESRTKPVLKQHLREQAKEIEVPHVPEVEVPAEPAETSNAGRQREDGASGSKIGKPKWMKNLIKK